MSLESLTSVLTLPTTRSLGTDAAERLRQAILLGHFEPGMQLREEVLANAMNVSRGPIREAFSILEREGLVVTRRNRGAFVAQLSPDDLEEVFSLRVVLERLAIQRFIERAGPQYLAELQQIVDTMIEYTERGITIQEAAELDVQFHETIFRGSGHQRLLKCWIGVRHQIHILLLSRNVVQPNFRAATVDSHQALLDLLRARDAAGAALLIVDHIRYAYEQVALSQAKRTTPSNERKDGLEPDW